MEKISSDQSEDNEEPEDDQDLNLPFEEAAENEEEEGGEEVGWGDDDMSSANDILGNDSDLPSNMRYRQDVGWRTKQ